MIFLVSTAFLVYYDHEPTTSKTAGLVKISKVRVNRPAPGCETVRVVHHDTVRRRWNCRHVVAYGFSLIGFMRPRDHYTHGSVADKRLHCLALHSASDDHLKLLRRSLHRSQTELHLKSWSCHDLTKTQEFTVHLPFSNDQSNVHWGLWLTLDSVCSTGCGQCSTEVWPMQKRSMTPGKAWPRPTEAPARHWRQW